MSYAAGTASKENTSKENTFINPFRRLLRPMALSDNGQSSQGTVVIATREKQMGERMEACKRKTTAKKKKLHGFRKREKARLSFTPIRFPTSSSHVLVECETL